MKKFVQLNKRKKRTEKLLKGGCIAYTCGGRTTYFKDELKNIDNEIEEIKNGRKLKWIFIQKLIETLNFY